MIFFKILLFFLVEAINIQSFYKLGVSSSVAGAERASDDTGFNKHSFPKLFTAEVMMLLLAYTNALWNFFIYSLHYREFQTGLGHLKKDIQKKLNRFNFKKKNNLDGRKYQLETRPVVHKIEESNVEQSKNQDSEIQNLEVQFNQPIKIREPMINTTDENESESVIIQCGESSSIQPIDTSTRGFNNYRYNPDNVVLQSNRGAIRETEVERNPTRTTEISLLEVPEFQGSRVRRISEVTACTELDSPRSQNFDSEGSISN